MRIVKVFLSAVLAASTVLVVESPVRADEASGGITTMAGDQTVTTRRFKVRLKDGWIAGDPVDLDDDQTLMVVLPPVPVTQAERPETVSLTVQDGGATPEDLRNHLESLVPISLDGATNIRIEPTTVAGRPAIRATAEVDDEAYGYVRAGVFIALSGKHRYATAILLGRKSHIDQYVPAFVELLGTLDFDHAATAP